MYIHDSDYHLVNVSELGIHQRGHFSWKLPHFWKFETAIKQSRIVRAIGQNLLAIRSGLLLSVKSVKRTLWSLTAPGHWLWMHIIHRGPTVMVRSLLRTTVR